MAKDDLDDLIDDIGLLADQQSMNDILDYQIDGIICSVLEEMGYHNIGDTGQGRSIFVELAQHFGRDISHILDMGQEYLDYWGNIESDGRDMFKGAPSDITTDYSRGKNVRITINDDAIYNQEMGVDNYPSPHPEKVGRDNSEFLPHHITIATELAETGNLPDLERQIDLAIERIIRIIEGR